MKKKRLSSVSKVQPDVLDGAYGWFVVAGCCISLFFCLAVNASMGPFFVAFRIYFQESAGMTSWISATVSFLTLTVGPIGNKATTRFGCRLVIIAAGILSSLGFILSSFAVSIYMLYFTIGILVGFSYGLIFSPCVAFLGKYFNKRHALANSLAFAGVGIGIISLSPLFQKLIDVYGWRGALLLLGGMNLNLCVAGSLYRPPPVLLKDRGTKEGATEIMLSANGGLPQNGHRKEDSTAEKRCDPCVVFTFFGIRCSLLRDSYQYAMLPYVLLVMGFGYYGIVVHLLPRAVAKGVEANRASLLVSVLGVLSLLSRFAHGWLLHAVTFISAFQLCVGSMVVCGLATCLSGLAWSFESMMVYCVLLGLTSGIFLPVVPVVVKDFLGGHNLGIAFPLVNIFMGVGSIMGPPASGWLYDITGDYDIPFYVIGAVLMSTAVTLFMAPCLKRLDERLDAAEFEALPSRPCDEIEIVDSKTSTV